MIKIVFIVIGEYAHFKFPSPMTVFIFPSKYYDTISSPFPFVTSRGLVSADV